MGACVRKTVGLSLDSSETVKGKLSFLWLEMRPLLPFLLVTFQNRGVGGQFPLDMLFFKCLHLGCFPGSFISCSVGFITLACGNQGLLEKHALPPPHPALPELCVAQLVFTPGLSVCAWEVMAGFALTVLPHISPTPSLSVCPAGLCEESIANIVCGKSLVTYCFKEKIELTLFFSKALVSILVALK